MCFLICVGMQFFTLAMILLVGDWAYSIHTQLFSVSKETVQASAFGMLTLMKTLGLMFFLAPWMALKIVARRLPE